MSKKHCCTTGEALAKQPQPEATPSAAEQPWTTIGERTQYIFARSLKDPEKLRYTPNSFIVRASHHINDLLDALATQERRAEEAEEALEELCAGHNVRGSDGPCDCVGCRALAQGGPDA